MPFCSTGHRYRGVSYNIKYQYQSDLRVLGQEPAASLSWHSVKLDIRSVEPGSEELGYEAVRVRVVWDGKEGTEVIETDPNDVAM